MLASIEDVYSDQSFDYLSYDKALEVAFETAVEQVSKANQEHHGEPRSMSEVMALDPEERNKWLKAAQEELLGCGNHAYSPWQELVPELP